MKNDDEEIMEKMEGNRILQEEEKEFIKFFVSSQSIFNPLLMRMQLDV